MQTRTDNPSRATESFQNNLPVSYNPNAKGVMGEFWKKHKRHAEIEELDNAIGRLNRSINASSYQLLVLIREFDERAGWLKWSFTDGVAWLKWRCDLGTGTAREKLRIAHALKSLPLISSAFANGHLSYSKVRVMTRVATADNEADMIALAKRMSVLHLTEHCKQRSNAQPASTAAALAAQNSRGFRVWHDTGKGTMHFSIELPVEEGELLEKAVEKAAAQLSAETGLTQSAHLPAGEEPTWAAMQVDGLVDVMRGYLSGNFYVVGSDGDKTQSNPQTHSTADNHLVMIHVDENALAMRNNITPDNTTSQYPIETVRRLCCDGSIAPIIENANGEPLNVGRRVRTVTTAIRRALWARDKGCAFPSCHHKRFVDAHHIKHWADGGKTTLDNLVLLCSHHHKRVHEGGFTIQHDQNNQLFFRRPDGKALPQCGYRREDWIDTPLDGDTENSREFFGDIFNETTGVKESAGVYCFH